MQIHEHYIDETPAREHELVTSAGKDHLFAATYGTSAQPAAMNYLGLTANTTTPVIGDTTLTGEITTAGGGLIRKQAVYAHTTGTTTATLTATFTANGSDALPVTIGKVGAFNALTAGTMGLATLLSPTATIAASGDSTTVTETITAT